MTSKVLNSMKVSAAGDNAEVDVKRAKAEKQDVVDEEADDEEAVVQVEPQVEDEGEEEAVEEGSTGAGEVVLAHMGRPRSGSGCIASDLGTAVVGLRGENKKKAKIEC